jgi:glycosyltransferase involved in cell wall biosynthesis
MKVSIIIATKNRAKLLTECLDRLTPQLGRGDEIVVVDNGSTDDTKSTVLSYRRFRVRYVYEGRPGASYARNIGFSLVTTEGIAFLDDDALVFPNWLREVKRTLLINRHRHPRAVYQGKMIQYYKKQGLYESIRVARFTRDLLVNGMHDGVKELAPIRTLIVANIFSYQSTLRELSGPFNASVFPFVGEEMELACRLIQKGIRLFYAPKARVIHTKYSVTLRRAMGSAYQYGRMKALLDRWYFSDPVFLLQYNRYLPDGRALSFDDPVYVPLRKSIATRMGVWWYEFWVQLAYRSALLVYHFIPYKKIP